MKKLLVVQAILSVIVIIILLYIAIPRVNNNLPDGFVIDRARPGIGWLSMRGKYEFRDSTYFVKPPEFNNGFMLDDTLVDVLASEMNNLDGSTDNIQFLFDNLYDSIAIIRGELADTVPLGDVALLKYVLFNAQTGTTYTFVLSDAAKVVTLSNTSGITVTVPPSSSVAFPTGTQITIVGINTGQVTVQAGSGVTINSAGGALKLRVRYSSATLIKTAENTWLLIGDITT